MSLSPAVLDAMLLHGCTAEQIVAAVKADLIAGMQADEARKATKREGNAERQAAFRARRKEGKVTRNKNNALRDVTPPIEDIHTPSISPSGETLSQRDDCSEVVRLWNEMAGPIKLSVCSKLGPKRRQACQARIRTDGMGAIAQAIERIPKSAFLRGDAGSWGGANIDFLLKPDRITQILEGKYDDRTKQPAQPAGNNEGPRNPYVRAVIANQAARSADERGQSDSRAERSQAAF